MGKWKKILGGLRRVAEVVPIPGLSLAATMAGEVFGAMDRAAETPEQKTAALNARTAYEAQKDRHELQIETAYTDASVKIHRSAGETLRVALRSADKFVSRASPAYLWAFTATFFLNYAGTTIINWVLALQGVAVDLRLEPVVIPAAAWAVTLAWFGVWRGHRDRDKRRGTAS